VVVRVERRTGISDQPSTCPECGGLLPEGATCDDLLVLVSQWEQDDFVVRGADHHLLVLCWQLQHPARFTDASLEWARRGLTAVIREGASADDLRSEAPASSGGAPTAPPPLRAQDVRRDGNVIHLGQRPSTLPDVVAEGPDALPGSIRSWAAAVLERLEQGD